jgi:hypothetical protein
MAVRDYVLRVVAKPTVERGLEAPPTSILAVDGDRYLCGWCGTLLLVAKPEQTGGLGFHCLNCYHYNEVANGGGPPSE